MTKRIAKAQPAQAITFAPGAAIPLRFINRHGVIAGATGAGKSTTVRTLVEQLSAAGVPVLISDAKGDLSGLAKVVPTRFWCPFGEQGLPIKTSVDELGQLALSRLLGLNDVQSGVLSIAFRWLQDRDSPLAGCRLMDADDLREVVGSLLDYADDLRARHGNVTSASVGAIQRAILQLEGQGGAALFGEPALRLDDLLATDESGRGVVNLIAADRMLDAPALYSALVVWLLTSLFAQLPEVGDADKPRLAIVVDEAHLLFADAPKLLVDTVERVVRLIRSRGVGVFFASQNALDIPPKIAAQLGNRVQHAMRAYTPAEAKAVRAVAQTFRQAKGVDTAKAIVEMGIGEALISVIGDGGVPSPVVRAKVRLPASPSAPLDELERVALIRKDTLRPFYGRRFPSRTEEFEAFTARLEAQEAAPMAAAERASWRESDPVPS
uniref:DUF853 domain-containing protein n=1 Tax=Bosea sp. NBC_00436 TaxID=2969620 RepID=A0A9E7ZJA4_9HYPH